MNIVAEIALLVYAAIVIAVGLRWGFWAALGVGIVGLLLLVVYSLCYVSGEAAQHEEDIHGWRRS